MKHQPKHPRRPWQVEMRDEEGRDDHRERGRNGRGLKPSSSQRPTSPHEPRESRHDHDSNSHARARHRPATRPEPASHRRRHSRDHSRERAGHPSSESTRRTSEVEDLIPRFRANKDRHREPEEKARRPSRSRERGGNPDSSTPSKRHRSRSPSLSESHRKRSRRDRSPQSRTRDYSPEPSSRKHGHHSSRAQRKSPPHRQPRSPRSPLRSEEAKSRPKHRSRSRSLTKSDAGSRRGDRESRHSRPEKSRHQSRSHSQASERRSSTSRYPHSSRRDVPETGGTSDRLPDRERRLSQQGPPRSPKSHRERRSREGSADHRHPPRTEVDDEMTPRGSYRGGYNPMYSNKSQYGGDPRDYSESPQQGGSYHTSPGQSPYGGGRSDWNGQSQFPPQQQYPPQYPQGGNYGPPSGPSGHYHSNQSHSAPYAAPTGPMQPYPQGNFRGGYRGGSFRGAPFGGRGGHRGSGFKSAQWNSNNQGPPRGHHDDRDDRFNTSNEQGENQDNHVEEMDTEANTPRPSEGSAQDPNQSNKATTDTTTPTGRQPPTGPGGQGGSGKFSFAFKASSKPTPTAPKPEISQKFNAAPQRREPQKDNRDREPPRSAPTEPASARSRHDFRNPPEVPKVAPRMRKVKKIMKRPKPRPTLEPDLVKSESVFFRKPGNESVVGSGTYGKVFKGLNVYTKGLVALKRIRMEGERDGFPVTAVREIKLLQSLRHVNIINLQEVMVEKNDCFMVFEYMSHDLTGLLNHPTFKFDSAQRKHMAKQLFEGLDYLHTRGVLHRDIKAANILVSNDGTLKLADFGLARFYAKRHQLDYTNRVITIWYRSPELLLGETQYTAAVDVWSAACVMVEIFTKHAIFPGDGTELSQLDKIYNLMGTPTLQDWPNLVDMAWFELLRPTTKRKSLFAEKYQDKVTPAAYDLLSAMFRYDPAKRPSAAEVLQHPYFVSEEPLPRKAVELSSIDGDWHEFESKALRKENERRDREARKAKENNAREKDKKRANDDGTQRDAKRTHVDKNDKSAHSTAAAKA